MTGYSPRVTDAVNRNWSAQLVTPVTIEKFSAGPTVLPDSGGAPLAVQCAWPTCNQPNGFGVTHGAVIGTPPVGVVSSYRLGAGSSGVTGSVLAR